VADPSQWGGEDIAAGTGAGAAQTVQGQLLLSHTSFVLCCAVCWVCDVPCRLLVTSETQLSNSRGTELSEMQGPACLTECEKQQYSTHTQGLQCSETVRIVDGQGELQGLWMDEGPLLVPTTVVVLRGIATTKQV